MTAVSVFDGGGDSDGVLLGTIVRVSVGVRVIVRVGVRVNVCVGVRDNVGVIVRVIVGVNERVGVGDMNPIGVRVGVGEGPAGVRVRVGVLLTLGVAEGTTVQVEVLKGSSVGVLDIGISVPPPPGVAFHSPPKTSESVTKAVKVAATSVSTCPGAMIVPSAGALTVDSAFTVAIRSIVGLSSAICVPWPPAATGPNPK